jgi:hypothetical protein
VTLRCAYTALLLLFLSGCATIPDISQSRSPCRSEPGGWCAFVRDAAVEAHPFAIAATNAYHGDKDVYADLGPALVRLERLEIAEEDAAKGFGYQIFEQLGAPDATGARDTVARILAFRGTDFGRLNDIFYGTLRNDQIEIALKYFRAERERDEFSDELPWIVVGHSLGGALATEVSIQHPNVRAYMFNTSPFYRGDTMTNDTRRMVINERGEFLRQFRQYGMSSAADAFEVNCSPEVSSISKHEIRRLSDCIAWIAAYASDDAGAVVRANDVPKPRVECGPVDKPHPGVGFRQAVPCVHLARQPQSD